MLRAKVMAVVAAAAALVGGCGDGGVAGLGGGQQADEIHPQGEENLGYLEVVMPTETPTGGYWTTTLLWQPDDGTSATTLVTAASTRVRAGSGCVVAKSDPGTGLALDTQACDLVVTAGATTVVPLAGVTLTWDPTRYAVDLPPYVSVRSDGDDVHHVLAPIQLTDQDAPAADRAGLVLAGSYRLTYSPDAVFAADTQELTLAPASYQTVELTAPDHRATVRVKQPARVLPDDPSREVKQLFLNVPPSDDEASYFSDFRDRSCSSLDSSWFVELDRTADRDLHVLPDASQLSNPALFVYRMVVNFTILPLALAPGDVVELPMRRLDVHDVTVTREDGTTYVVAGSYSVSRHDGTDWQVVTTGCSGGERTLPTGTGLDVVPGMYRVRVWYQTEQGPQSRDYELDLR